MTEQEAKELLKKYENGLSSPEEKAFIESWYLDLSTQAEDLKTEPDYTFWNQRIKRNLPVQEYSGNWKLWTRVAAAAVVFIVAAAGLFFYTTDYFNTKSEQSDLNYAENKIKPGGNRAYLTLANGKKLSLTDAGNGELAKEADVEITKTSDGQLIYTVNRNSKQEKPLINTIETPKGGQYQILLPDGTKVWLNSATTFSYPTKFTGTERRVELKGEGYFEVAHDKSKPFRVVSKNQTIEVLGTHFNVNSYSDEENIKTTLVEGQVKVKTGNGHSVVISPGDQAVVENGEIKVLKVNTDDVIAWINNTFVFNHEELGSIMKEISRWYDIEVICSPEISKRPFSGTISRQKGILEVLEVMSLTQSFHYKIEGRRISVMP